MFSSCLCKLATRWAVAIAWSSVAWTSLACGDSGAPPLDSEEPEAASETSRETVPDRMAQPATATRPAAGGCAGTCQEVCDCLAAACRSDGAARCEGHAEECHAACERFTCSTDEPACWGSLPGGMPLPPDGPEPPLPGPEPDPSPVEAAGTDGARSRASSPAPGGGPG